MFVTIITIVVIASVLICLNYPSIVSSEVIEVNDIINGKGNVIGKSYIIKTIYSNGKIKIEEKRMRL